MPGLALAAVYAATLAAAVLAAPFLLDALFRVGYERGVLPAATPDAAHRAMFSALMVLLPALAMALAGRIGGPPVAERETEGEKRPAVHEAAAPPAAVEAPEQPSAEDQAEEDASADAFASQYTSLIPALLQRFFALVNSDPASDPSSPWTLTRSIDDGMRISVYQNAQADLSFKLVADLDVDAGDAFEALADSGARASWDDMTAESYVVQVLDTWTRIVYLRTRPVFPVSARDMVSLSHITRLGSPGEPPTYVNVTCSVDHPSLPPSASVVRMKAGCAGQLVRPLLDPDTGEPIPGKCRVVQLVDGDLGGSVPSWLVSKVAGSTIPGSLRKLNKHLVEAVALRKGAPRPQSFVDNGFVVPERKKKHLEGERGGEAAAEGPAAAAKANGEANGHLHNGTAGGHRKMSQGEKKAPPQQAFDLGALDQFNELLPTLGFGAAAITVAAIVARRAMEA
ncbi:hypothetical protein DFJ74DRAFT_666282 [Hyaloraphidium curvatum]|nr:hypothetical protein DFJ74DRAFT_666282 [Hyaloraphidium curvatum]